MPKTGHRFVLSLTLLSLPGTAWAASSGPSQPTQPPIASEVVRHNPDRPVAFHPVIVDDLRHPLLLPEWHPQGMEDRVRLAMQADFPGAQVTLNVRF
jgi:hypothetical protein